VRDGLCVPSRRANPARSDSTTTGVWFLSVGCCSVERMFEMMEAETIQVIPDGLDEMVPGPYLAAILSATDVASLSGYDRVVVLRAHQRMVSHYSAQIYADMVAISDSVSETEVDPEFVAEASAAEIRVALRLTRRTADFELGFAIDLRERLPLVWEALSAGDIDLRRARTIEAGTAHLDVETATGSSSRDHRPGSPTDYRPARSPNPTSLHRGRPWRSETAV